MVITDTQKEMLVAYRDKAYVSGILCDECYNYNAWRKNIIGMPLIFCSSIMTVFNSSSFDADTMKIPNIILNSLTTLILALIGNFKFVEKQNNFHSNGLKFNRLCHKIEDALTNDIDNIGSEKIRDFIDEYDVLNENLEYPYVSSIKDRIRSRYYGKKTLPNALNCTTEFSIRTDVIPEGDTSVSV